jgi:hypothetical protein
MNPSSRSPPLVHTARMRASNDALAASLGLTVPKEVALSTLAGHVRAQNDERERRLTGGNPPALDGRQAAIAELLLQGESLLETLKGGEMGESTVQYVVLYISAVQEYMRSEDAISAPKRARAVAAMLEAVKQMEAVRLGR